ncbi:substrate-binding domain-containing protein, partial [Stenotrophomonas sp.]
ELSQNLESTLTVAVAAGVPDQTLLEALARVGCRYPLLRVNLLRLPQDQVREMLHQERADLVLLPVSTEVDREEAFTYVTNVLFIAVASATADTPGLPAGLRRLEDLSGSRQIVVAGPDDDVADRRLLVSDARWHVDSVEAALGLVERGAGWANLPADVVEVAVSAGRVKVLAFDNLENGVTMPVHLVWLRRKPVRRAAGDVIALMRDHL